MRTAAFWLIPALAISCAPLVRPASLDEAARTRASAASRESSELAPQAYLAAEKLRKLAERALDDGDRAEAEALGEQAVAAYTRAHALARLARAEERRTRATERLSTSRVELSKLEAEQQKVGAEAADLEARVRVRRDAQPIVASEPASADREKARLTAARALVVEARLLCAAGNLLAPNTKSITDAFTTIDALEATLAKVPARTPIDDAVRLRARCLAEITQARQAKTAAAPETGKVDALLDELSKAGHEPSRDDRGVVVVLRDVFQGQALAKASVQRLTALGQVARQHPDFPVIAVVHNASTKATEGDRKRAELVAASLREGGAPVVEARAAGNSLPAAPPGMGSSQRNERLEIVYVAPTQ